MSDTEGQARLEAATAEAYSQGSIPVQLRMARDRTLTDPAVVITEQAHIIADLDAERARLLRQVTEARALLRDVRHMIANGALNTADEYVDRALTALSKQD
jgi:hypothetical protein